MHERGLAGGVGYRYEQALRFLAWLNAKEGWVGCPSRPAPSQCDNDDDCDVAGAAAGGGGEDDEDSNSDEDHGVGDAFAPDHHYHHHYHHRMYHDVVGAVDFAEEIKKKKRRKKKWGKNKSLSLSAAFGRLLRRTGIKNWKIFGATTSFYSPK